MKNWVSLSSRMLQHSGVEKVLLTHLWGWSSVESCCNQGKGCSSYRAGQARENTKLKIKMPPFSTFSTLRVFLFSAVKPAVWKDLKQWYKWENSSVAIQLFNHEMFLLYYYFFTSWFYICLPETANSAKQLNDRFLPTVLPRLWEHWHR